jgi:D-serine dehydratase
MEKKPLRNGGIITKNEYVGKTYEDARTYAEEGGFTTRIVEEDGKTFMLEYSVNARRLNFRISNNIVTDVFGG